MESSLFVRRRRLTEGELDENMLDMDIKDRYKALIDNIGAFVDAIEGEEQPYLYQNILRQESTANYKNLKSLGLYQGLEDARWMAWLAAFSTCNTLVVSMVIWSFLESKIFNRFFPVGVEDEGAGEWQRLIVKTMDVMPGKVTYEGAGPTAHALRSALMIGIVNFSDTVLAKEEAKKVLFDGLKSKLGYWVRRKVLGRHKELLRDKILHAAIELHQGMRCSQSDYEWKPVYVQRGPKPQDAENWNLRNITTWISTKYSTIDGIFHPLFPGLWRRGVHETDEFEFELVKPMVIAYKHIDSPEEKYQATSPPSADNLRQNSIFRSDSFPTSTSSSTTSRGIDRNDKVLVWGHFNPFNRYARRVDTAPATVGASSRPSKDGKEMSRHHRRPYSRRDGGIQKTKVTTKSSKHRESVASTPLQGNSPSRSSQSENNPANTGCRGADQDSKESESDIDSSDYASSISHDDHPPPPPKENDPSWNNPAMSSVPRNIQRMS